MSCVVFELREIVTTQELAAPLPHWLNFDEVGTHHFNWFQDIFLSFDMYGFL